MKQGRTPRLLIVALMVGSLIPTGCAGLRGLALRRDPMANTKCVLGQNPTLEEVVAHVNANVDKIQSWKADNFKIAANTGGISLPVTGHLYVEREHRLRLEVSSFAGKEVDFGSNDDIFWIWSKRGAGNHPPIFYASHEDLDLAQQQFPIPFEPKWLMEALSVAPLPLEGVRMEGAPGIAEIRLVSNHTLPSGPVKKVVLIDACHGRVMEHSTYDANNRPLIRVRMGDHRIDKNTGAILPRYVKLDWPQQDMSMEMTINQLEVNPPTIASTVWDMPKMEKTQLVNLGGPPGRRRPQPTPAAVAGRPRTALVSPESIPSETVPVNSETEASDAEEFELPQVERPVNSVELEEPQFAPPNDPTAPAGRSSISDWLEGSEDGPQ